jgi:hypothetical protein
MPSTKFRCWRFLALAIAIASLCLGVADTGRAQRNADDIAREAYNAALHEHAKARGGAKQPSYFAIVRRGMDQFEELAKKVGATAAGAQIKFDSINAVPAGMDSDPRAQLVTSVRLGITPVPDPRIVNGWPVEKGEFDEAVALTGNKMLCSGIALDGSTVLTAAHCACDLHLATGDSPDDEKKVYVGISTGSDSKQFPVRPGETRFLSRDLRGLDPCSGILANILGGNPDLALVRVANGPMDLPLVRIATPELMEGAIGTAGFFLYGFGCTKPIQPGGPLLGCDTGSIGTKMTGFIKRSANCTDPSACAPGGREFALQDLGGRSPIDTCAGDSGGPVIVIEGEGDSLRYHLVGITSRPFNQNGNCGDGGIYAKIGTDEVITWLKMHVNVQH